MVNFFGRPFSFHVISFVDAYNNVFDTDLKNKIVLIGEMGTGLHDEQYVPTSFSTAMPGVEIHANAIQTILSGKYLQNQTKLSQYILIFVFALIFGFIFLKFRAISGLIISLLLLIIYYVAAIYIFSFNDLILNVFYVPLSFVVTYLFALIYRFLVEERERKKVTKAFSHYVNPTVVNKILDNPEMLKLGGDKKELTVYFSDIAGFTSISEQMKPEALVEILNEYLNEMTNIILDQDGTLDKYIGDAIMAFWGAPLEQQDHAKKCCHAILKTQKRLDELRKNWAKQGHPDIVARAGINTGDMIVGNVGSWKRFDYTVMGDNVNLASRLEGVNKQYETRIMISEKTYKFVKDEFVTRKIDCIRVKGKKEPIVIYEMVDEKGKADIKKQSVIGKFEEALDLYFEMEFRKANAIFEEILEIDKDDGPSKVYVERCQHFIENPPPADWDGVFTMKTK